MAEVTLREGVEWIAFRATLPIVESPRDGRAPYHPEMVGVLAGRELLVIDTIHPSEVASTAGPLFEDAVRSAAPEDLYLPEVVRVANEELANALRLAIDARCRVVCEPTPEADDAARGVAEQLLAVMRERSGSFLGGGHDVEAIGAFFAAVARYVRARPWDLFDDENPIVSVEALGIDGWIVAMPKAAEGTSFYMLPDLEALAAQGAVLRAIEDNREEVPPNPEQLLIGLCREDELPRLALEEITQHGWEIAGANAYPQLAYVRPDGRPAPVSPAQLALLHAAVVAIAQVAEDHRSRGLESLPEKELFRVESPSIATSQGDVKVSLMVVPAGFRDALRARAKRYD